jgi:hypothetical protein
MRCTLPVCSVFLKNWSHVWSGRCTQTSHFLYVFLTREMLVQLVNFEKCQSPLRSWLSPAGTVSVVLHVVALPGLCGLRIDPTTAQNCFPTVAAQMPHRLSCIGFLASTIRASFELVQGVYPILYSWLHKAQTVQTILCRLLDSFCPPRTPPTKIRVW